MLAPNLSPCPRAPPPHDPRASVGRRRIGGQGDRFTVALLAVRGQSPMHVHWRLSTNRGYRLCLATGHRSGANWVTGSPPAKPQGDRFPVHHRDRGYSPARILLTSSRGCEDSGYVPPRTCPLRPLARPTVFPGSLGRRIDGRGVGRRTGHARFRRGSARATCPLATRVRPQGSSRDSGLRGVPFWRRLRFPGPSQRGSRGGQRPYRRT